MTGLTTSQTGVRVNMNIHVNALCTWTCGYVQLSTITTERKFSKKTTMFGKPSYVIACYFKETLGNTPTRLETSQTGSDMNTHVYTLTQMDMWIPDDCMNWTTKLQQQP